MVSEPTPIAQGARPDAQAGMFDKTIEDPALEAALLATLEDKEAVRRSRSERRYTPSVVKAQIKDALRDHRIHELEQGCRVRVGSVVFVVSHRSWEERITPAGESVGAAGVERLNG